AAELDQARVCGFRRQPAAGAAYTAAAILGDRIADFGQEAEHGAGADRAFDPAHGLWLRARSPRGAPRPRPPRAGLARPRPAAGGGVWKCWCERGWKFSLSAAVRIACSLACSVASAAAVSLPMPSFRKTCAMPSA